MKIIRLLLIAVLCWIVFIEGARHGQRVQFTRDQDEMLDAIQIQQMKDVLACRQLSDTSLEMAARKIPRQGRPSGGA